MPSGHRNPLMWRSLRFGKKANKSSKTTEKKFFDDGSDLHFTGQAIAASADREMGRIECFSVIAGSGKLKQF